MNCKNSAQNALQVAIFRLKIETFSGEGAMPLFRPFPHWGGDTPSPNLTPRRLRRLDTRACGARPLGAFGASILAPSALDLGPPFANPGSATVYLYHGDKIAETQQ